MQNLGWKFYIINASYNFIFLGLVYFLWPETKGQSLEAIALHFEPAEIVYGTGQRDIEGVSSSFSKEESVEQTVFPDKV